MFKKDFHLFDAWNTILLENIDEKEHLVSSIGCGFSERKSMKLIFTEQIKHMHI